MEDVNRAGGIITILKQLADAGLIDTSVSRVDGLTLRQAIDRYAIGGKDYGEEADRMWHVAPGGHRTTEAGSQDCRYETLDTDRVGGSKRDLAQNY